MNRPIIFNNFDQQTP